MEAKAEKAPFSPENEKIKVFFKNPLTNVGRCVIIL